MTDPIDISEDSKEVERLEPETKIEKLVEELTDGARNLKKSRLSRPKSPPPPVPLELGKFFLSYLTKYY